jgi:hypothetical protein
MTQILQFFESSHIVDCGLCGCDAISFLMEVSLGLPQLFPDNEKSHYTDQQGLNPRILYPMASTITITPPRTTLGI